MLRFQLLVAGWMATAILVSPALGSPADCNFSDLLTKVDAASEKHESYLTEDELVFVKIRRALSVRLWEDGRHQEACEKLTSLATFFGFNQQSLETLEEIVQSNKERVEREIGLDALFSFVPSKVLPSEIPNLRDNRLAGANLLDVDLSGEWLAVLNLDGAILQGANLSGAILSHSSLRETLLVDADLTGSLLGGADFQGAILHGAKLSNSYLRGANLTDADLYKADLSGAWIVRARLANADLSKTNLAGTLFEPLAGSLPATETIARASNLHLLKYSTTPHALFELRSKFRERGYRQQERAITYAIEHTAMEQAGTLERFFKFMFFDLTCQFGMSPWRPLKLLFLSILLFAMPYMIAISTQGASGIWSSRSKHHLREEGEHHQPVRLSASGARMPMWALYFSVLSAFRIGWRDYNIGTWIVNLLPVARVLRPSGWVRPVATVQSVLSVYLYALWALTYFGRPFEW